MAEKRLFIIHGWGGNPEECFFPWLKKELEIRRFDVEIPAMPDTENPRIDEWVSFLKKAVDKPDENTFFLGHSIGCQAIMRYTESLPKNTKVGGIVLVAGWINLMNLTKDEIKLAKPWLETPIHWNKIKTHAKSIVAIFSDNDRVVPLSDSQIFEEKLGAKIIIEHSKGHFSGKANILQLPSALESILEKANMERPMVGIGVLVVRGKKALFLKRKSPYGKGTWCYPGGHLEFGETIFDAGIREVKEETGLKVNNPRFLCVTNDISKSRHYITIFMKADYVSGNAEIIEKDKFSNIGWFDINKPPKPLFIPTRDMLDNKCMPERWRERLWLK